MKKISLTFFCLLLLLTVSSQSNGALDSTFNLTGKATADFGYTDLFTDVKIQPDQKIVASGISYNASYGADLKVFRFLPNGTYDPAFGTGGIFTLSLNYEAYAYESFIKSDGSILVAGITTGASGAYAMLLLRLKSGGTIDSTFGTNGITVADFTNYDDIAQSMTVQSDGKILLAGMIADSIMRNIPTVARFTSNGMIDSTFGVNGIAQINIVQADNEYTSVIQQPDGKILASGHCATSLFTHKVLLTRFNANGTLDSFFGTGGNTIYSMFGNEDESFGMQLKSDGHILLAGFTTLPGYNLDGLLMQYDSTGALDSSFGSGGVVRTNNGLLDVFNDMKIQADGKILCAGTTGPGGSGDDDFFLCQYKSNGMVDSTFGVNGFVKTQFFGSRDDANAMAIQADGKIVLAGKANNVSGTGVLDYAIARYRNQVELPSTAISNIDVSNNFFLFPNPATSNETLTIKFDLKTQGSTKFKLYSATGEEIETIDFGNLPAGEYQKQIEFKSILPTGIYFIRFMNKDLSNKTIKLIIYK